MVGEMSDPGNFEFEPTPERAADQPAPGWYFAQGDPPGTERYWSGFAWEGTYRAIGGFSPTEVIEPLVFPVWAKVIAWVLTVLKALPLAGIAVLLALWGSITAELENESDFAIRDFSNVVLIVGIVTIVVGLVLLLGQLVAVMKEQLGRAVIWSGVLALVDIALVAANYFDGSGIGLGIVAVVTILQVGLFAVMYKMWNDRKPAATD